MMETWYILAGIVAGGVLTGLWVYLRYRREVQAARKRVAEGGRLLETKCGPIEYEEVGQGAPVLLIHGAGGGYDQGLLFGGLILGEGFRMIAPSRFGYLKSPVPKDSSLEAQADAFAGLLDALEIDRVAVAGLSAGGLAALQFARRYPERTAALIMVAALSYTEPPTTKGRQREARINRIIGSDLVNWFALQAGRRQLLSLLGVPKEVQKGLTKGEMAQAERILKAMLPMSRRLKGVQLDQSRQLPADFPLAQISAPTLVIHARDDSLVDWSHGQQVATQIKGAEFMALERGGHLLLGQVSAIRAKVSAFLAELTG